MTIQRGEIYFVNLNPVQGREQAGQRNRVSDERLLVKTRDIRETRFLTFGTIQLQMMYNRSKSQFVKGMCGVGSKLDHS